MKKRFILYVFLLIYNVSAFAQNEVKKRVQYVSSQFGVTEGKAVEIIKALDYNQILIKQVVMDTTISSDEKVLRIKKLKEEQRQKIKAVLTIQQQEIS